MRARLDLAAAPGQLTGDERNLLATAIARGLATLTHPLRIWHGPRPAETGRPRATWLAGLRLPTFPPADGLLRLTADPDGPSLPAPLAESVRALTVAGSRSEACLLALAGWPAAARLDWLSALAELPQVAAVVVHLDPIPAALAARLLRRRRTALAAARIAAENADRQPDPAHELATDAVISIQRRLAAGETVLLRARVHVAVTAEPGNLPAAAGGVVAAAAAAAPGCRLSGLPFEQRCGWTSLFAAAPPGTRARVLDVQSAAVCVPLPAPAFLGPPEAPRLGTDPRTGAPVRMDRFAEINPGRLIVGASGAGKSFAARAELRRYLRRGAHALVVDPEGEFAALAGPLGGLVIPGGVDPVQVATDPALPADAAAELLVSSVGALLGARLAAGEVALLDAALADLRAGAERTLPALAESVARLSRLAAFRRLDLAGRLAPATSGRIAGYLPADPALGHPPPLVVADLRAVPDALRPPVTAGLLGWTWARAAAAARPGPPRLVLVDEAHLLLADPAAARFLAGFARRARKYGIALDVVTQRLSDFLADPAGRAVLDSAATRLLLGVAEPERSEIAAALGLSAGDAECLLPDRPGTGLLVCPRGRLPIRIEDPEDRRR